MPAEDGEDEALVYNRKGRLDERALGGPEGSKPEERPKDAREAGATRGSPLLPANDTAKQEVEEAEARPLPQKSANEQPIEGQPRVDRAAEEATRRAEARERALRDEMIDEKARADTAAEAVERGQARVREATKQAVERSSAQRVARETAAKASQQEIEKAREPASALVGAEEDSAEETPEAEPTTFVVVDGALIAVGLSHAGRLEEDVALRAYQQKEPKPPPPLAYATANDPPTSKKQKPEEALVV